MSVPRCIMAVAIGAALFLCAVPQIRAEKLQRPMIQVGVTTMGYHGGYLRTGGRKLFVISQQPPATRRVWRKQAQGHGRAPRLLHAPARRARGVVVYIGPGRDLYRSPQGQGRFAGADAVRCERPTRNCRNWAEGGVNRPYILYRPRVQMGNGGAVSRRA